MSEPIKSIRPSRSERPGLPRMLATLIADPGYLLYMGIMAIAQGITSAILKWQDNRKAKKLDADIRESSVSAVEDAAEDITHKAKRKKQKTGRH